MNANGNAGLINRTDLLDHTTLNVTLKELASRNEQELTAAIRRILESNHIETNAVEGKPYGMSSKYYVVDLSDIDIDKIIDILYDLEASHRTENGNSTPTANFYASLADKWETLIVDS